MNFAELAARLALKHNLSTAAAKAITADVFAEIVSAAKSGEDTSIPGFGKFAVKNLPAREGRNPATGATITIAAARKLAFSAGKAVKGALNG